MKWVVSTKMSSFYYMEWIPLKEKASSKCNDFHLRGSPLKVFLDNRKHAGNLQENIHVEVCFKKIAKKLCWNHTSALVFPCKFAAFFRTFFPYISPGGLLLSLKWMNTTKMKDCHQKEWNGIHKTESLPLKEMASNKGNDFH